jgi:hypothetical protein
MASMPHDLVVFVLHFLIMRLNAGKAATAEQHG